MEIVIIEDEELAAFRLENMLKEINTDIVIKAKLESVSEAIAWFNRSLQPDLIFLDIHLEDGLSFNIIEKVKISCPIVFTTATDEETIKSFKSKKIEYLLKPIVWTELKKVVEKYQENNHLFDFTSIEELARKAGQRFRER